MSLSPLFMPTGPPATSSASWGIATSVETVHRDGLDRACPRGGNSLDLAQVNGHVRH